MAPEKGNLVAIELCKNANVPLDIVGGRGFEKTASDPPTEYEKQIQSHCDGEVIRLLGEVTEPQKLELMKTCKALIYATDHPEVTSHKVQEAMFCGAPVIVPNIGAMPEIVTHGVNGYLCSRLDGYLWSMDNVDKLRPGDAYDALLKKYSIQEVVKSYIPLYEEVANGLRWK
jgi:glycosyltransferase involved in cell wall biosynthesis